MKEQHVTFETAKLLRKIDFQEEVNSFYNQYGVFFYPQSYLNWNYDKKAKYSAPTQCLVQKWLREKYNIYIDIVTAGPNFFVTHVGKAERPTIIDNSQHKSYEKALEVGLQEGLKLIINELK